MGVCLQEAPTGSVLISPLRRGPTVFSTWDVPNWLNMILVSGSSRHVAQWLTNPTRSHEVEGSIPGITQWVDDLALL